MQFFLPRSPILDHKAPDIRASVFARSVGVYASNVRQWPSNPAVPSNSTRWARVFGGFESVQSFRSLRVASAGLHNQSVRRGGRGEPLRDDTLSYGL